MKKNYILILLALTLVLNINVQAQRGRSLISKVGANVTKSEKEMVSAITRVNNLKKVLDGGRFVVSPDKSNLYSPSGENNLAKILFDKRNIQSIDFKKTIESFIQKTGTEKGFNNEDVKELQKALNSMNKDIDSNDADLEIDGLFGKKTIIALNKFKQSKNDRRDGSL